MYNKTNKAPREEKTVSDLKNTCTSAVFEANGPRYRSSSVHLNTKDPSEIHRFVTISPRVPYAARCVRTMTTRGRRGRGVRGSAMPVACLTIFGPPVGTLSCRGRHRVGRRTRHHTHRVEKRARKIYQSVSKRSIKSYQRLGQSMYIRIAAGDGNKKKGNNDAMTVALGRIFPSMPSQNPQTTRCSSFGTAWQ